MMARVLVKVHDARELPTQKGETRRWLLRKALELIL